MDERNYENLYWEAQKHIDELEGENATFKRENERLQALVDIENTYGHLYLVAMRHIKNEWGEDKYWELFDAVCKHFDTLLKGEKQ